MRAGTPPRRAAVRARDAAAQARARDAPARHRAPVAAPPALAAAARSSPVTALDCSRPRSTPPLPPHPTGFPF